MGVQNVTFTNDSAPQCEDLYLNSVRAEINNLITNTGQTPSTGNLNQLGIAAAIMAGGADFYSDSGVANAYVLSPIGSKSAPHAYFTGMCVSFFVGQTNTGASTINVNSLGVKNIKARDATSDPASGDFVAGQIIELRYNGTNFIVSGGVPYAAASTTPAGTIFDFAGSSLPSGYLWCYGQAISRTTYATLFGAIGTAYGTGDGSTTFNVPDMRGRVRIGLDNMGGVSADRITATAADSLNNTGGGLETTTAAGSVSGTAGTTGSTTITTSTMPAHTHTQNVPSSPSGGSQKMPQADSGADNSGSQSGGIETASTGSGGSHSHAGGTISATFTGSAVTSTPPWVGCNTIIKF